jgi:hypothetical protein
VHWTRATNREASAFFYVKIKRFCQRIKKIIRWFGRGGEQAEKCLEKSAYLKVSDGSAEGVVSKVAFLVQKLARFPIGWRHKQPIVEALL